MRRDRPLRLGLLSHKAIHYQAPLYRRLAADPRVDFTALFVSGDGVLRPADVGYGRALTWSGELLDGYRHVFLRDRQDETHRLPKFDVVREVRKRRFDVLWVNGYNNSTLQLGLWTQRALGRAVMVREEQTLIHRRSLPKTLVKELVLRQVLGDGPGLYLGTESARWLEHYGVPTDRLVWAPYAVDNEALRRESLSLTTRRDQVKRSLGIRPDGGPVIVTVSRLVPSKQPDAVITAFRALRANTVCTLLIVGGGELEVELKRRVEQEGIPDVVFAGFVNRDRIGEVYASADIFTLFSRRNETWGMVVNEAMNFRLPVVVSDRCGCARDLVRHGYNGYVVPADRPDELAKHLLALVSDPARRESFGREGLAIVERYSYAAALEGVVRAGEMAAERSTSNGRTPQR